MERAEAVAVFAEHTPFSVSKARKAVKKADFSFEGMEVVARGSLEVIQADGEAALRLVDPKAEMSVLLSASDTAAVHEDLLESVKQGRIETPQQVRGHLVETEEAQSRAGKRGADFVLALTSVTEAKVASLPPLRPAKQPQPEEEEKEEGWF